MIRLGHIAVAASMALSIPAIRWIMWVVVVIMTIIAVVQRISGMRHAPDPVPDTWYYVGSRAPERLPERAPERVL